MKLILSVLLIAALTITFSAKSFAQQDESSGSTGAIDQTDANLEKDAKKKDSLADEGQAIVALQCVTGDCYKDAFSDPCGNIGESCIRPSGSAEQQNMGTGKTNK